METPSPKSRPAKLLLAPVLAMLVLAGCASPQKMFERARQYEAGGDYVAASREYVDVLERESDWGEARTRLEIVGPIAMDSLHARARGAESAGRYPRALEHLDALASIHSAASKVGVALALPSGFQDYRAGMVDRSIGYFEDEGHRAAAAGAWRDGLEAYDRALRYEMPEARKGDIQLRKAEIYYGWARDEMDEGRFRGAFAQAERGLEIGGRDADLADRLAEVQDDALYHGTRIVAMLPLMEGQYWGDAPGDLRPDLDAELGYDYWARPPLFIESIDQGEIRRRIRDLNLGRRAISKQDAVRLGRALEADYVVVGEVRRYREREELDDEETQRVRLRGSRRDTTYTLRTMKIRVDADTRFYVVAPASGQTVAEYDILVSDDVTYKRGSYSGNVADLDLSRREEDYFGAHLRVKALSKLNDQIIDELARQISQRTYNTILEKIP